MNHGAVETESHHLHEHLIAPAQPYHARPERPGALIGERIGNAARGGRQLVFLGQDIGSAERDDAERGLAAEQPVGDLGNGAVAAGRHHHKATCLRGLAGQRRCMAGMFCLRNLNLDAVIDQQVEHAPQSRSPPAPGNGIENDQH